MSDSEYDSSSSSSSSSLLSEDEDCGPCVKSVVGGLKKGNFEPLPRTRGKDMTTLTFLPIDEPRKPKSKSTPLLRRLRVYDSKKTTKRKHAQGEADDSEEPGSKSYNAAEPDLVRKADDIALETHPVLIFLREHTPVRPCGRCHECRKPPCNTCTNCRNNQHLTERSRDRKRCIAHGCSKLTDEELVKYRNAYAEEDKMGQIERELRELRNKLMVEERNVTELEIEQKKLLEALETLQERHITMDEDVPDGYECLLLSVQTLETERDRIARLVKRRTTRDSPEVMRTRRQLRNYYGLRICDLARKFATDMIARQHVQKLIEIAGKYEELIAESNKVMVL